MSELSSHLYCSSSTKIIIMCAASSLHSNYLFFLPSPSSGHLYHILRVFYGGIIPKLRVLGNTYFCMLMRTLSNVNNETMHVLYVSVFSPPCCTCKRSAWTMFLRRKSAIPRPSFKLFLKTSSSETEYCSNASFLIFCRNAS